jgi:predicted SAM-dependent methyltransferase
LLLFSHRLLAIAKWDLHLLRIRIENFVWRTESRMRKVVVTHERPVFLNLGSGPRGLDDPHWVNVDAHSDTNVRFLLDFNRPLPFLDGSLDGVFCEHVLEHFTLAEGEHLMREVCRCLRPGGVSRIIVPDGERVMKSYFEAPDRLDLGLRGETPMEAVNSYFRQRYEHQFLYDWDTLSLMLRRAGFTRVERSSFGDGTGPIVIDHPKYEWESLYANAVR